MIKSLKLCNIIFVSLLFLFFINTAKIHSQTNLRWQETKFNINLNGSLGIGFYPETTGTIDGGLGVNLDIIFLNLKFMNLGVSSGFVSLTNSKTVTENTITGTFPINVMLIKYFRPKGWEMFPYIHFSPGAYLKTDLVFPGETTQDTEYTIVVTDTASENDLKFGTGFSTGAGLSFAINTKLFLNCDLRFHLMMIDENIYNILSNSIGLSLYY